MIVCDACVAVPLSRIVCVTLVPFRLLSVRTRDPLTLPVEVGAKLIGKVHDAPIVSVPPDKEVFPIKGQAVAPLLVKIKLAEMLGLLPLDGIDNISGAFPSLYSVATCGLSELVAPIAVELKLKLGASARSLFNTRLLRESAI